MITAAAFTSNDPSQPVGWVMEYGSREVGSAYTVEAHRRKGLCAVMSVAACQSLLRECPDLPVYGLVKKGDRTGIMNAKKLGFVESNFQANDLMIQR